MLTPERRAELEAIADEIFANCDWFEPSERGAGWAPTDKGYENVIHVLSRAKAVLWDRDSPAERRKAALAERRRQQKQAALVANRLLGTKGSVASVANCIHCKQKVTREAGCLWKNSHGDDMCQVRKDKGYQHWNHEAAGW